jgi:hypothetical protein
MPSEGLEVEKSADGVGARYQAEASGHQVKVAERVQGFLRPDHLEQEDSSSCEVRQRDPHKRKPIVSEGRIAEVDQTPASRWDSGVAATPGLRQSSRSFSPSDSTRPTMSESLGPAG